MCNQNYLYPPEYFIFSFILFLPLQLSLLYIFSWKWSLPFFSIHEHVFILSFNVIHTFNSFVLLSHQLNYSLIFVLYPLVPNLGVRLVTCCNHVKYWHFIKIIDQGQLSLFSQSYFSSILSFLPSLSLSHFLY